MRDDVLARIREDAARLEAQIADTKWRWGSKEDGAPSDIATAEHLRALREQLASIQKLIAEWEDETR